MRERHGPVPALLATYPDVALRFGALPSGDYILAEDAAVERKTASDFVASILDLPATMWGDVMVARHGRDRPAAPRSVRRGRSRCTDATDRVH